MLEQLEQLYQEARSALKAKDYDRASGLLRQILPIDENYKDASRLLAQTVKLRRRRWYNHPVLWTVFGVAVVIALGIWFAPKMSLPVTPTIISTQSIPATVTLTPTHTAVPSKTLMPTPTTVPLIWKRLSIGQEFSRDTVTAIVVDPTDRDIIYIGMQNAGLYKSIDGGSSWFPIQQGITSAQVRSMVIDHQNPQILLAGTLGGVFKTMNGGEEWQKISSVNGLFLLMDGKDSSHLYLSDGKVIYVTTNQGSSWNNKYSNPCNELFTDMDIDPQNSEAIYLTKKDSGWSTCKGGLYRSLDGGKTWETIGLRDARAIEITQDENKKSIYFASGDIFDFPGMGLHIISNDGKNWEFKRLICNVLTANIDDPSMVYCGAEQGGLHVILAHGGIVNSSLSGEIVTAIFADQYNGNERIVAGTEKNGVYISTDGGKSWSHQLGGIGAAYFGLKTEVGTGEKIYANIRFTITSCSLYRSDDHGRNWTEVLDIKRKQDERWVSSCNPAVDAENNIYTVQYLVPAQSNNGGNGWKFLVVPPLKDPTNVPRWISANPYAPGLIYLMVRTDPFIYYSDNFGQSWHEGNGVEYYEGYENNNSLFFADSGQVIYGEWKKSVDAGKTWQSCTRAGERNERSDSYLAIDPQNSNRIIFASYGGGIQVSINGCGDWTMSNTGLASLFTNTIAVYPNSPGTSHIKTDDLRSPDIYYIGTDGGAYVSFNGGQSWEQINDGLLGATVVYSIVADKDGNLYAATPYGIFKLEGK